MSFDYFFAVVEKNKRVYTLFVQYNIILISFTFLFKLNFLHDVLIFFQKNTFYIIMSNLRFQNALKIYNIYLLCCSIFENVNKKHYNNNNV